MIRRAFRWLGLDHLLPHDDSDEIVRVIRHQSAHTTLRLTVIGCILTSAAMRLWFPELEQTTITLAIVALFMMITSSLINSFHGVDQAEEELRDREPTPPHSLLRTFAFLFVLVYAGMALTDVLFDRTTPGTMDLVGYAVKAALFAGFFTIGNAPKNKRRVRSS